jgi:preprotein translocase subunit SecA
MAGWSPWSHSALVARLVDQVLRRETSIRRLSDSALREQSLALRYRAWSGTPLEQLVPDGFALVREAASRRLGQRHYEVQLQGGVAMFLGAIAEMQTGEGKTLTLTLPTFLHALPGQGVHVATANDYLASRDARLMRPVYEMLGLTVGVIEGGMGEAERRQAYRCDITYGTAKEFGFDFLRDRLAGRTSPILAGRPESPSAVYPGGGNSGGVQRGLHCALLDEADSLLIDEARTPLVVSALASQSISRQERVIRWAAEVSTRLEESGDWRVEETGQALRLTPRGRQRIRDWSGMVDLDGVSIQQLWEQSERALTAATRFQRDRHYLIRDQEVVIIDEFSGRPAEGRRWRDGLHQAIEAKEGLPISPPVGDAARVTLQEFFLRYQWLGGMSGTARSSSAEFRQIYRLAVRVIPTHRPTRRRVLATRVLPDSEAKWGAILQEVRQVVAAGRPVLIGTRSIDKSERLAEVLEAGGITPSVLNARHLAREAEIVAASGTQAGVTVATNMAGRGTDIQLSDEIRKRGGLHVIGTELHESARIDRQLVGRCGRQGDPGSFRQYLALDDEILVTAFGLEWARDFQAEMKGSRNLERYASVFSLAQRKVERRQMRDRKRLMRHERERRRWQEALGEDPHLDGAM